MSRSPGLARGDTVTGAAKRASLVASVTTSGMIFRMPSVDGDLDRSHGCHDAAREAPVGDGNAPVLVSGGCRRGEEVAGPVAESRDQAARPSHWNSAN